MSDREHNRTRDAFLQTRCLTWKAHSYLSSHRLALISSFVLASLPAKDRVSTQEAFGLCASRLCMLYNNTSKRTNQRSLSGTVPWSCLESIRGDIDCAIGTWVMVRPCLDSVPPTFTRLSVHESIPELYIYLKATIPLLTYPRKVDS